MWKEEPQTVREYLNRSVLGPWLFAGVMIAFSLALLFIVFALGRDPTQNFGPADSTSRVIWLSVVGVIVLVSLVLAPMKTRDARALAERGRKATGRVVSVSPLGKYGAKPVTIEYKVDGESHRVKRDMSSEEVATFKQEGQVTVIYDPDKPSRCAILPPEMARLPME